MSTVNLRNAVEWVLMVALVFGAGAIAQAQEKAAADEGRIIQIGPDDDTDEKPAVEERRAPRRGFGRQGPPQPSGYWIGLLGGSVQPALRAHLDIPAEQGVVVREVVPGSPAAEAGLKQFDILLRADDIKVRDMSDLIDLVRSAGENQAQITLEVLRRGQRETVWVTPAMRPDRPVHPHGPRGLPGGDHHSGDALPENMREWLGHGFGESGPLEFRRFGSGLTFGDGHGSGFPVMPNGVSVNIQKQDDAPAKITVKRGGETWEVVGDDPKALEQLPEDLRPFVAQLLNQTGRRGMVVDMPSMERFEKMQVLDEKQQQHLQQRLKEMEQRMREFEQRLGSDQNDSPDDAK